MLPTGVRITLPFLFRAVSVTDMDEFIGVTSFNHDSHSLLDFLPSNICAKARQIRLEGLRRIPSLSWALADPPGFSRKQPFYRLLLVTRDLDSIRVDHLEPVILGRVVASSNHHTCRIPRQFYQEL